MNNPVLSAIHLYPVKSCGAISLAEAVLGAAGVEAGGVRDREWMVVDEAGGFLTQRELPRMALVTPRLADGVLELSAPDMPVHRIALDRAAAGAGVRVRLWDDDVVADDCGDAGAAWFARAIGARCRLVRFGEAASRQASMRWTGGVAAPTRFADGYPVLVIGAASLDDLNGRLAAAGRAALPMDRFRPNLVIDGLAAFEEDYVEQFTLGALALRPVKPCPRCPIPAIDQATGIAGADPLDILQGYRGKAQLDGAVCFGMNCIVTAGAGERIHVGQQAGAALLF